MQDNLSHKSTASQSSDSHENPTTPTNDYWHVKTDHDSFWIKTMKFLEELEEILTSSLELLGLAWWIEIVTEYPQCTYYFGPFISAKKAQKSPSYYVQDLEGEEAQGIFVKIKQFQPKKVTICEDE